tara:strand:- start:1746 stop:4223 length:2478 start_codon:yes stop_codon:yes gene_type:complete
MPRRSLQLNDFSGGLNTKSSPRDIAPNQVQKADNVFLSNPGLVEATSDASSKSSAETMTHTQQGNGAFIFNLQFNVDSSGTATQPSQTIAYPIDKGSTDKTTIQFFRRDFDATGNFTLADDSGDAEIDMQVTGAVQPVYYFVDGVLHVSDKLAVDSSITAEPRRMPFVKESRLDVDVTGFLDTTMKVEKSSTQFHSIADNSLAEPDTAGEFSVSIQTDPTLDNITYTTIVKNGTSTKLVVTPNPNETNPNQTYDIGITDKLIHLKLQTPEDMDSLSMDYNGAFTTGARGNMIGNIIFINQEAMRVRSTALLDLLSTDDNKVLQLLVDRDVFGTGALEHGSSSEVQTRSTSEIAVTSGGWEAGSYEFCHTVVDLQDNETLPQTPQSTLFALTSGAYFTNVGFIIKDGSYSARKNEKGVRVYTRKKDGNGRWILFLDVDYQRGVRTNLFEDYTGFTDGQGTGTNFAKVTGIDVVNPSLDTYESINGYSQDEENIDFGTKGGFKAATVCARRAWVANVRKDDKVYDDRVYYSPVNRFATFPDSYYLDIGISDGDSFTALHSLGNRLLAFKQKKLYVINVSSTSDAGWFLEAEYDGMGCRQQESVCKTPFGVCWVNDDGVYIFDGSSSPKELTANLDDAIWRTNQATKNPAIGYNNKYKQLNVVQDAAADTDVFVFDFARQGWSITKSIGTSGISNFLPSFDGLYFLEYGSSNTKTVKLLTGDVGTKVIDLRTKDIDFGNPGLVKKVKRVFVTARGNGTNLTLGYSNDGESGYNDLSAQSLGTEYATKEFTIAANDRDCESMSFKITADGAVDINDINIDYRQTNKRPS